jgi:hypothetical protein
MSDDRFTQDSDDEYNANDKRAAYVDRSPPPGVRPAIKQPDRRGPPTPEEIAEFIAKEYPETHRPKRVLIRPAYWNEPIPAKRDPGEDFER